MHPHRRKNRQGRMRCQAPPTRTHRISRSKRSRTRNSFRLTNGNNITALEAVLGHRFARPELLEQALTHSSHAHEAGGEESPEPSRGDNEQLEFLGDAVLSLTTSEALFQRFPSFNEGQLSKMRAHLV